MEPGSLIAIISVSFTSLGALLTSLFHSMSLSRCSRINCCCMGCERQVLSEEAYLQENKNQRTHLAQPVQRIQSEEDE